MRGMIPPVKLIGAHMEAASNTHAHARARPHKYTCRAQGRHLDHLGLGQTHHVGRKALDEALHALHELLILPLLLQLLLLLQL